MKIFVEKVKRVIEFGGTYAAINLIITSLYTLLYPFIPLKFLVELLLGVNIIYALCYIFISKYDIRKHPLFLFQLAVLFFTFYLYYSKEISSKIFIYCSNALNLFFLAMHYAKKRNVTVPMKSILKKQLLPLLNSFKFLTNAERNYQPAFNYHPGLIFENKVNFSQHNSSFNQIGALNDEFENNQSAELDEAEYQLREIKIGDTLASWAITIPYRPSHHNIIPSRQTTNRILKRMLDIVISLFVVIFILSWLIPLIGIFIKLESRGAVLFRQLRSGLNNQPFWCYKFRSMHQNEECDELQATKGDKRITKIGAFLRKTSIDELPQFINVLRGEMSIVGPRPHMLKHTEEYGEKIHTYMERLSIKQGVTGWAQVNGLRGETTDIKLMEERVKYDLWYMKNWSLWLDIKIIYLTVIQIFKNRDNVY